MSIEDRVLGFLREPGGEAEFQALALAVFAHQYGSTPVYRRFCELRGLDPARVRRWSEIPALPADAFKLDLEPRGRPHVFLSSGTTAGPDRRSCHAVSSLTTYRESALGHFRRMVLADGAGPFAVAVLGPTAASHPHSSLGRMFSWCAESFSNGDTLFALDGTGRLDLEAALTWLGARAEGREPVLILTLSSALTAVFDALRSRGEALRLPAESRIVDTGGRKGCQRVLSPAGILKASWSRLHVPAYLCLNEYGMTEMLSQFYDDALESRASGRLSPRAKVGPPWVRSLVVDPATLEPLPRGETGLLRHVDLANWESVSALQTLDLARETGRGFELRGRAGGAEARGCSLLLADVRSAVGST